MNSEEEIERLNYGAHSLIKMHAVSTAPEPVTCQFSLTRRKVLKYFYKG